MLKKISISLLAIMILFTSSLSLIEKTKAVGLDTAVKIVAGSQAQKVVRGIGEKMGVKWSQESLDATTDYMNAQADKGNVIYADFGKGVNDVANAGGTTSTTNPAWKKYALDPLLWLTGADLLLEGYQAFQDAKNAGSDLEFYYPDGSGGYAFKPYTIRESDGMVQLQIYPVNFPTMIRYSPYLYGIQATDVLTIKVTSYLDGLPNRPLIDIYVNGTRANYKYYDFDASAINNGGSTISRKIDDDDTPDYSSVSNTWVNTTNIYNTDNSVVNNITYNMEVETDTDTTYRTDPINTKIEEDELTIIVKPIIDVDVTVPPDDDSTTIIDKDDGNITITNNNNISVDGIDVGDEISVPKNFFTSLTTMAEQLEDVYEGITTFFKKSVDGMRDLTDGMSGFVSFLDTFFDWLPSEFRTLLGVGFTLGVASFFLRR